MCMVLMPSTRQELHGDRWKNKGNTELVQRYFFLSQRFFSVEFDFKRLSRAHVLARVAQRACYAGSAADISNRETSVSRLGAADSAACYVAICVPREGRLSARANVIIPFFRELVSRLRLFFPFLLSKGPKQIGSAEPAFAARRAYVSNTRFPPPVSPPRFPPWAAGYQYLPIRPGAIRVSIMRRASCSCLAGWAIPLRRSSCQLSESQSGTCSALRLRSSLAICKS
jgi:hypothetical protein